jgi:hypothetical protein
MTEIQPRISIRCRLSESQHPNRPEELGSGSEVHRFRVQFGHQFLVKGQNQAAEPHLLSQNEIGNPVRCWNTSHRKKGDSLGEQTVIRLQGQKGICPACFSVPSDRYAVSQRRPAGPQWTEFRRAMALAIGG